LIDLGLFSYFLIDIHRKCKIFIDTDYLMPINITRKLQHDSRQYIGGLWQIPVMRLISGNDVAWKEKGEVRYHFF
jgi:hypothetical protein